MPISMSEIRKKYPMYDGIPDETLLASLHKKHYADLPVDKFMQSIDMDTTRKELDPTKGVSGGELFQAGFGKAGHDLVRSVRRVGNTFGIGDYDQAAAKADEKRDAPLMNTGAGTAGNVTGNLVMTAAPGIGLQTKLAQAGQAGAKLLPKALSGVAHTASPYLASAGAGATAGALTSPADMTGGASVGGVAGTLGEGAGRIATAGYKGIKNALDPLSEAGRHRILNRTFNRFATDINAADKAMATPNILVPGTKPTLAELTQDAGLAQLQRSANSVSPDVGAAITASNQARANAYADRLRNIAGTPEKIADAEAKRAATTQPYYDKAVRDGFNATPEQAVTLEGLMNRPSLKQAMATGERMAKDAGDVVSTPLNVKTTPARTEYDPSLMVSRDIPAETTVSGGKVGMNQLMNAKTGLDDMIGESMRSGNTNNARILLGLKDDAVNLMGDISPAYLTGNQLFAELSAPINRMKAGEAFYKKAVPALNDFGQNPTRMKMNSYAEALREGDKTVQAALGHPGAKMDEVFYPHQIHDMNNIAKDMARYTEADALGAINGSRTAQNLAGQNVIEGVFGPLGLPHSASNSAIGNILSKVANYPAKWAGNETEKLLGEALTDPAVYRAIRNTKDPKTWMESIQPYASQLAIQAGIDN